MSKLNSIKICVQGGVLQGTTKSPQQQKKAQRLSSTRRKSLGGAYADRNSGALSRSVRRSKVNFAQNVGRIKNRPTYFFSLILPCRLPSEYEHIVLEDYLKKFFKQLTKHYPRSYFIRFLGWSQEAGLHAHVLARFGIKSSLSEKEKDIQLIWAGIVNSISPHLAKVVKYHGDAVISYLTSAKKDHELRVAVQKAAGSRIWSTVNRKNIRWHEKIEIAMNTKEHRVFKRILRRLIKNEKFPLSNLEQLKKEDYCLNYLPAELLTQAAKKFLKWRKQHEQ